MNNLAAPTGQPDPDQASAAHSGRGLPKRLLALTLLGAAIALAVVQITNAISHDTRVELELTPEWAADLERLEVAVSQAGQAGAPAVLTVFTFDAQRRPQTPIAHTFSLPNGRYELMVKLFAASNPNPVRVLKPLEVSGDATQRFRLP